MKTRKLPQPRKLAGAALLWLASVAGPVMADTSYAFGVVPQFEARRLSEIWTPILDELEKRVGIDLRFQGSPKIPEFERAFARGEFDISYMNPYHALVALDSQGYQPIIRDGDRQLFGVLIVRKDSDYREVSDLQGARIAFPAPNALGASLLMRAELDRQHGLDFTADYVNTHTSAYLNVVLGDADAAGGVMGTFNRLDPAIREHLRVIYKTAPVPPHPIVVHPRVPSEVATRIQDAFLELAATPEGAELLAQVPIRNAVKTDISEYQMLRDFKLEDYYVAIDEK